MQALLVGEKCVRKVLYDHKVVNVNNVNNIGT